MEYVYAAAILNELDREINEENVKAVLEAAGADVSESRVKALIAALEDVDIDERIAAASPAMLPEDERREATPVESGEDGAGAVEEADETMPEPAGEEADAGGEDEDESTDLTDIF